MKEDLRNPERQLANIAWMVSRGAELHPDRIAIDDLLSQRRLSYGELNARITQFARGMIGAGIGEGDMVATMFWNEHAIVETIFACARIGAIVAPLNVRLLGSEVTEYVNDHDCRAIVANAEFAGLFAGATPTIRIAKGDIEGWQDYEAVIAAQTDTEMPMATCFDEPWRLVSTGGTTGKSKGVLHSHVGTLFTVLADIAEYGIRRFWQTLSVLPAYHVAGMEWGLFTILWRGGTVVFPATKSFDPVRYLAEVRTRDIEYLPLVPALINPLFNAWDGIPLTGPRTVVTTAAPTSAPLRRKLSEMFPEADILAAAGLSESLNMATQSRGELLEYPESIGMPHVDTRVLILDDHDRPVTARRTRSYRHAQFQYRPRLSPQCRSDCRHLAPASERPGRAGMVFHRRYRRDGRGWADQHCRPLERRHHYRRRIRAFGRGRNRLCRMPGYPGLCRRGR